MVCVQQMQSDGRGDKMKDVLLSGYLAVLSFQDIKQKKVSLWLLLAGVIGGVCYAIVQQRGFRVLGDILPGTLMCMMILLAPKALGIGDGIVGVIYGLFYGWRSTCVCLMLAFGLTVIVGVTLCIGRSGRRIQIPFIPFLMAVHVGMYLGKG